jgi:hypothetical protein
MHLAVRTVDGSDATSFAPIDALSRASIVMGHDVYRRAPAASHPTDEQIADAIKANDDFIKRLQGISALGQMILGEPN